LPQQNEALSSQPAQQNEAASSQPAQQNEAANSQTAQLESAPNDALSALEDVELSARDDYDRWLEIKLQQSREWLANAGREKLSIQVMMRKQSAARELVYYLLNEWPLALGDTYLYEVVIEDKTIYRVFYSEFDSVGQARAQIDRLPDNVKANLPYVHSVYRMRRDLL
jgi:septal ring-binding cell division protein DamX